MKIKWTPRAVSDFNKILVYLYENWGIKELENFINQTDNVLHRIAQNPQMFIESKQKKDVRKGVVTRHNSLFYRINPQKKEIQLLTFWDNRKDPKKLNY
ncbi:MAG: type II toxin-antitoxin system RelE/ParE family toxin [Salinivirgaceae bacterium]